MPSILLKVVAILFQTRSNNAEHACIATATGEQLVNTFVATCLQVCRNFCVFKCFFEEIRFLIFSYQCFIMYLFSVGKQTRKDFCGKYQNYIIKMSA